MEPRPLQVFIHSFFFFFFARPTDPPSQVTGRWEKKQFLAWPYDGQSSFYSSLIKRYVGIIISSSHVSGYFWIRNLFFQDSTSVHKYPVYTAYESPAFWIRSPEWKFLNTLWIRDRVDAKLGKFTNFNLQWIFEMVPSVMLSHFFGLHFQVL